MIAKLICQNALASPRTISLDSFPIELGRGATVGVRIDDRWLSRRHCVITQVGDSLEVRDLNSTHGTYVNGQRISQEKLLPGQVLQLGLTHFLVQYETSEDSAQLNISQSDPNLAVA